MSTPNETPPRAIANKGQFPSVLMDALKAVLDLFDMGLVTAVYPEGTRGHTQVEQATQHARLTLAATRRYGNLYGRGGEDGRTESPHE